MPDPSKTESATPRRREEARKRGQVPRSIELNTALGILGVLVIFQLAGGFMLGELAKVCRSFWADLGQEVTISTMQVWALRFGLELLYVLSPLLLGVFVVGVLSNALQFGWIFASEAVRLRPENLNPAQGFQRVFSRRSAVELFKGFIKIGVVGWVAWSTLSGRMNEVFSVMHGSALDYWGAITTLASAVILRIGLALLLLAILDAWYQHYEYEDQLKMSKQEVKDEFRQLEGDPQIKARIRRLQQESARRRMMAELPAADVVITNPTHLAVAVKYDDERMDAPMVIAKGARLMAERIKAVARENRIPVMENKPLARALYESTPVGARVPSALFDAVAVILAEVYRIQGTLAQKADRQREKLKRRQGPAGSPKPGTAPL